MLFSGFINKYRYEAIAFLTSASVLTLEIIGARFISPHFGSSIYVWTAMIGVILGFLSIGYWYGGKLADKQGADTNLSIILTAASVSVLLLSIVQDQVLQLLASFSLDIRIGALLGAIILFGVPSLLIGVISPSLAKIRIQSLSSTGRTIGRLEAAGAIGSISGTFLCGYFLLSYFGASKIAIIISVVLLLASFLSGTKKLIALRLTILLVALVLSFRDSPNAAVLYDTDTAYTRYQVVSAQIDGRPVNKLVTDGFGSQSAVFLDDVAEPVFDYTALMSNLMSDMDENSEVLIVGGGAHTQPMTIRRDNPSTSITVVEIDPDLRDISERFFGFRKDEKMNLRYEDGRIFLNQSEATFDVIVIDAFSSLTPPFQLSSFEAIERIYANVSQDGVVLVNIIGNYDGDLLSSMVSTYQQRFGYVSLYAANSAVPLSSLQNFVLVAAKEQNALEEYSTPDNKPLTLPASGLVLTDDYAPIERLTFDANYNKR